MLTGRDECLTLIEDEAERPQLTKIKADRSATVSRAGEHGVEEEQLIETVLGEEAGSCYSSRW